MPQKIDKLAQKTISEIDRLVGRSGREAARQWREWRDKVQELLAGVEDPALMQSRLALLMDDLSPRLEAIVMDGAAAGADEGQALARKAFEEVAAERQLFVQSISLNSVQREIIRGRVRNEIKGLTAKAQAAVSNQIFKFIDPNDPQGITATMREVRKITKASAAQVVTQIRTEVNLAATDAQAAQEREAAQVFGYTGQDKFTVQRTNAKGMVTVTSEMLFPRDNSAPPGQVFNCGCSSAVDWEKGERVWISSMQGGHDGMNGKTAKLTK